MTRRLAPEEIREIADGHDAGDEDRRPVIRDYLDAMAVADSIALRRREWTLVGGMGRSALVGQAIDENRDLWRKESP